MSATTTVAPKTARTAREALANLRERIQAAEGEHGKAQRALAEAEGEIDQAIRDAAARGESTTTGRSAKLAPLKDAVEDAAGTVQALRAELPEAQQAADAEALAGAEAKLRTVGAQGLDAYRTVSQAWANFLAALDDFQGVHRDWERVRTADHFPVWSRLNQSDWPGAAGAKLTSASLSDLARREAGFPVDVKRFRLWLRDREVCGVPGQKSTARPLEPDEFVVRTAREEG